MADQWLWADPIVLNFNRVPAYKEGGFVNGAEPDPLYKCNMYESLVRTRLTISGLKAEFNVHIVNVSIT